MLCSFSVRFQSIPLMVYDFKDKHDIFDIEFVIAFMQGNVCKNILANKITGTIQCTTTRQIAKTTEENGYSTTTIWRKLQSLQIKQNVKVGQNICGRMLIVRTNSTMMWAA
jgi:hypothetical protein